MFDFTWGDSGGEMRLLELFVLLFSRAFCNLRPSSREVFIVIEIRCISSVLFKGPFSLLYRPEAEILEKTASPPIRSITCLSWSRAPRACDLLTSPKPSYERLKMPAILFRSLKVYFWTFCEVWILPVYKLTCWGCAIFLKILIKSFSSTSSLFWSTRYCRPFSRFWFSETSPNVSSVLEIPWPLCSCFSAALIFWGFGFKSIILMKFPFRWVLPADSGSLLLMNWIDLSVLIGSNFTEDLWDLSILGKETFG